VEKSSPKMWATLVILKNAQIKQLTNLRKFAQSGPDVMITIFCNFLPILGKTICVFLKNQCYDPNFAKKLAAFCTKKPNFWRKYFLFKKKFCWLARPGFVCSIVPLTISSVNRCRP
jgi:hypothetical protein